MTERKRRHLSFDGFVGEDRPFDVFFFSPFLSRPRPTGGRKLNDRFMLLKKEKEKHVYKTEKRGSVEKKLDMYVRSYIYIKKEAQRDPDGTARC